MSNFAPFLLVATLVAAMGAATVSQAQAAHPVPHAAALHTAHASVGPAVLVLARR